MIDIIDKHNCCGCSACVQACPKQCIGFNEDEQGFRYPLVNKELCIDCGLCEKVCPCLNQSETRKPLNVYAAINPNEEIRMKSSSGGIFTLLAEKTIDEGGVVFGARFDENWEVKHDYTETKEGLESFRGSKYVQSRIGETFKQAKTFLGEGRKVLFSGTSCQIAGLKKFLRKEYDNLLTVDVVCHGVPSPLVWREYLKEVIERPKGVAGKNTVLLSLKEKPVITGISFRDKTTGWKKFGFVIRGKSASKADKNSVLSSVNTEIELVHETLDKNLFLQVFLKNLCLRPSCHNCPVKSGKSGSNMTIADYWSINLVDGFINDNKGVSLILVNDYKGKAFLDELCNEWVETTYADAFVGNPAIEKSAVIGRYSNTFRHAFGRSKFKEVEKILRRCRGPVYVRFYRQVRTSLSYIKHSILKINK